MTLADDADEYVIADAVRYVASAAAPAAAAPSPADPGDVVAFNPADADARTSLLATRGKRPK